MDKPAVCARLLQFVAAESVSSCYIRFLSLVLKPLGCFSPKMRTRFHFVLPLDDNHFQSARRYLLLSDQPEVTDESE